MERNEYGANTIISIWELKKEYRCYRIYLWMENRADLLLFTRIAFSGVRIEGFCNNCADTLSCFMGRPVVTLSNITRENNTLLIYGEKCVKEEFRKIDLPNSFLYLYYEDLFEVRRELLKKNAMLLYDSVAEAKKVAIQIQKYGIKVIGTCALGNKKGNFASIEYSQEKLIENSNDYNIILASDKLYCEKSILCLPDRKLQIYVPSKDIFYTATTIILLGCLGLYLNKALQKGKRIVLYGTESWYTNAWMQFLYNMNIDIYKIVNDRKSIEENVNSVYDLAYENKEEVFIIINKKINLWVQSCDLIDSLGFSEFNEMYTGLYAVGYRHFAEIPDITLGYVTSELIFNSKYKGFHVYGEEIKEKCKIITLGGSTTTSAAFRVTCWPEFLYKRLEQEDKKAIIYNGGVDGYTAANELYKLIRDVGCLKPDLIISFSGINNRFWNQYPYVPSHLMRIFDEILLNGYNKGLESGITSAVQVWVQQEQMMQAIAEKVYHAKFICFIQPMYISKKVLMPWERLQFETSRHGREMVLCFRKEMTKMARNFEWMIDLQDFLDERPDVFLDNMHVYEEGNRMIADKIYEYVKNMI